jgi:hypothetical protein
MKSGIRNAERFDFLNLQVGKVLEVQKRDNSPKQVTPFLSSIKTFVAMAASSHPHLESEFLIRGFENILGAYLTSKLEDKEMKRKRERKSEKSFVPALSKRQLMIASHISNLRATRGIDPVLCYICELIHFARWGTKNAPTTSSSRSVSKTAIKSKLLKKQIVIEIAEVIFSLKLLKAKSLTSTIYYLNTAYGEWNAFSLPGFGKTSKLLISSKKGWIPNS